MTQDVTDKETPADTAKKPPHFVTFGQRVHKWSTYLSVDLALNYVTGMLFTAWGRYTNLGKNAWTPLMRTLATSATDALRVSKAGRETSIVNWTAFFSVIAGGMFTVPPLKFLENKDRRLRIVQWFDKKHYGEDRVKDDPRFAEVYKEMLETHQQTGSTGLISRLMALAPLLATVLMDKPRDFTQPYFDKVAAGSARVYNAIGLTKERLYKKIPAEQRDAEWKWLHANSAIDAGLELPYALLHMVLYRGLAMTVGKVETRFKEHQVAKKEAKLEKIEVEAQKDEKKHDPKDKAKLEEQITKLETEIETDQQRIAREKPDSPKLQVHHVSREEHLRHVSQVNALSQTPA